MITENRTKAKLSDSGEGGIISRLLREYVLPRHPSGRVDEEGVRVSNEMPNYL